MPKNNKKIVIKTIVGVILLSLLLFFVDYKELASLITSVDPFNLMVMVFIPHIAILISVIKWNWLLKVLDIKVSMLKLYKLYLVGTFFNNFFPSMVGGDLARVYLLGVEKKSMSAVTAATIVERLSGLAALVSMLLFSATDKFIIDRYPWLSMVSMALIVGFVVFCLLLFSERDYFDLTKRVSNKFILKVLGFIRTSRNHIRTFRGFKTALFKSYLISFVFYYLAVLTVYYAAQTIQVDISIHVLLIIVPIVLTIGLLPISLNGIGVNETSWVVFLSMYGVSFTQAVTIGLLIRARILLTSLVGGVFYLFLKKEMNDINDE